MGKKPRLSQPNLHVVPIKEPPRSQSSIESQDSGITYEGTRSTYNNNIPCPPSYSPASQRSRYSQPNLPALMISYNEHSRLYHYHQPQNYYNHYHRHYQNRYNQYHCRSSIASPDRRIRMSQPTLNSSFFGINFVGGIKGSTKLSYSSLRTSGDNSINSQIQQERLSTPNVNVTDNNNIQIIDENCQPRSMFSQPDICRIPRSKNHAKTRERLSQPTLVTGDYYPVRMQHHRLSQPCLSNYRNDKPLNLHSPMKQKRPGSPMIKINQRERISQLDFGSAAKFRYNKELTPPPNKFNRDRFSIPELETQNDLRLIAGTPKQRYSLDSQLNPELNRQRRLLPIASSPISECQIGNMTKNGSNKEIMSLIPSERLENIIIASATPIIQSTERQLFAPILKPTPPTLSLPVRERMSVPEIRNASLRRLLDPPIKQRHSITGNLRQSSISIVKDKREISSYNVMEKKLSQTLVDITRKITNIECKKVEKPDIEIEPKHIQRHYSYTYDSKPETNEVIGKLGIALPRKKYLESNFDKNEQVITTVIETEIPVILGCPKYNKKTHVYASETPKWMKKCLENDNLNKKLVDDSQILNINQMNLVNVIDDKKSPDNKSMPTNANDVSKGKNTFVRIKSPTNTGESKYEVTIKCDWTEANDTCRLGEFDCDTGSENSTSI